MIENTKKIDTLMFDFLKIVKKFKKRRLKVMFFRLEGIPSQPFSSLEKNNCVPCTCAKVVLFEQCGRWEIY